MQNQNVPFEMLNVNIHRHSTNSAVADWNSKRISIIGKQQTRFSAGTDIKTGSRVCILAAGTKGTWTAWPETRRNAYVKQDKSLERIMEHHDKSNDLYKCRRAFSCTNTWQCVLMSRCGTQTYGLQLLYVYTK